MKLACAQISASVLRQRRLQAMTLAETMVASSIFLLAVTGLVLSQLFGLSQDQFVNSQSGACELARMSFNDLTSEIRAAKIWQVGNVSNGNYASFSGIANGTAQQGSALKLSLTIDTNQYIVYYFATYSTNCVLYRQHSGDAHPKLIAQYLTNAPCFKAQQWNGTVQTDLSHKGVVDVLMQFCQYQYPITKIGPNFYYNYYKMELRATPHVPDGS